MTSPPAQELRSTFKSSDGKEPNNSVSSLIKQISSINWQSYLFIPHVFANLATIIVCFLFYGIYILLDQYLHTILISLLVGASLKPIKNAFVTKLLRIIYRKDGSEKIFQPLSVKLKKNFLFNAESVEDDSFNTDRQKEDQSPSVKKSEQTFRSSRKLSSDMKKINQLKNQRKKQSSFSQLRASEILGEEDDAYQSQPIGIRQIIWNIIWQSIVVSFLIFVFYLVQDTPGLVIMFIMLVGEYLIGVLYQIFRPIIKVFLKILFGILQYFYEQSRLKKTLSKFLSVLFIILVIALIVFIMTCSVFLIYKDVINIKEGINQDFIKKDFLNYSTHIHKVMDFIGGLNVTKELTSLMPESIPNYQHQKMIQSCQSKFNSNSLLKLIPETLKRHLCNFYVKYDYQTLQNYLPVMKQIIFTIGSIVGLSFSSVFGLFNFTFLAWFKLVMFLSTTYYITEDFNLGAVENLLGKFINITKSRTDKITDLFFQIKNIMFGSVKISFLHFMLSWIVFDYFNITNFNFILSLFLGFMALVPIYHPFIGAFLVFFCSWWYKPDSWTFGLLVLSLFYLILSNTIFSLSYSKLAMPSIFTNLSVILGIYSFGILGVVYGPIIVTILRGVLNEFRKF